MSTGLHHGGLVCIHVVNCNIGLRKIDIIEVSFECQQFYN